MSAGWNDKRPMAPHLSVWKWHPTMLSSILHRMSGIILYFGVIKLCIFAASLAAGPDGFDMLEGIIYSPLGVLSCFVACGLLIYHLLNGIRHLVWDAGKGFDPVRSNQISLAIIAAAGLIAALITFWIVGALS